MDVPVLIVSSILALYGHLRALSSGYTDEAALARAVVIFLASVVVLRLLGGLVRAWRRHRGVRVDPRIGIERPSGSPLDAYLPRREYLRDKPSSDRRNRAA